MKGNQLPLATVIMLFFVHLGYSQKSMNSASSILIPLDSTVKYGQLENGFTYYIKTNNDIKGHARFNFITKVGSNYEEETQREFAHMIEHLTLSKYLSLRDVKNYSDSNKRVSNTVRYQMAQADISGYTSPDHTLFYINIENSRDTNLINEVFKNIFDWSHNISFDEEQVNKERYIIKGEKSKGLKPIQRILNDLYSELLSSKYFKGQTDERIKNLLSFETDSLKQFYKRWYRPDLQALVIVGDIDIERTEEDIKSLFENINKPKTEIPTIDDGLSLTNTNSFFNLNLDFLERYYLNVFSKTDFLDQDTQQAYKDLLVIELFKVLFHFRIYPPGYRNELDGHFKYRIWSDNSVSINVGFRETSVEASNIQNLKRNFFHLITEIERISRHGFTKEEFEKGKKNLLERNLTRLISDSSSVGLAKRYVEHFVTGKASPSIKEEVKLNEELIDEITLNEVVSLAKNWFNDINRDIIIAGPIGAFLPDEKTIIEWIMQVKNSDIGPDVPKIETKKTIVEDQLMTAIEVAKLSNSTINKTSVIEEISTTQLILKNGIKIFLKPVANEKISLEGFTPGGTNSFTDEDFWSAYYSAKVLNTFGINQLTKSELDFFSKEYDISTSLYISENSRGIYASAKPESTEIMFKSIYKKITSINKDEIAFRRWIENEKLQLQKKQSTSSIYEQNSEAFNDFYAQGDFRKLLASVDDLNDIHLDKILEIYQQFFMNTEKWNFIITGDFQVNDMKQLVAKYLGNIPYYKDSSLFLNLAEEHLSFKNKSTKKTIYGDMGKIENATVLIRLIYDYVNFDDKQFIKLKLTSSILYQLVLERLRKEEGLVYSPKVYSNNPSAEEPYFMLSFANSKIEPDSTNLVIQIIYEELEKLRKTEPSQELLYLVKPKIKSGDLELKTGYEWSNYLKKQLLFQRDLREVLSRDKILEDISSEDISEFLDDLLDNCGTLELIFMPESYRPDIQK